MSDRLDLLQPPSDDPVKGNCGITAVAIVAGVSFAKAHAAFMKVPSYAKRYARARTRHGATTWSERQRALVLLGVDTRDVSLPRRMNLLNLVYRLDPSETYIVTTTRHVQVVRGRYVTDQRGAKHVTEYWGAGKLVQGVQRVVR